MNCKNELTYSEQLSLLGIEEYENYTATVTSTNAKGCVLRLEKNGMTIYLVGSYPVNSILSVSFSINNRKRKLYPTVEWVEEYGFDIVAA